MEREQPIEAKYRKHMNALAHFLGDQLKPSGFALFVFDMNAPGRMNYISNAERPQMVEAMMEFIARNDGKYVQRENVFHVLDTIEKILDGLDADVANGNVDTVDVSVKAIRTAIQQARDFHE